MRKERVIAKLVVMGRAVDDPVDGWRQEGPGLIADFCGKHVGRRMRITYEVLPRERPKTR